MKEKLSTIWWFIQHPDMYSQIWQLFLRRFILKNDRFKENEAIEWCKTKAISEKEAIQELFPDKPFLAILDKHPEEIRQSNKKIKKSPFEMGGAGALDLLYNITLYCKATNVLETGVSYGLSSLAFLLASREQNGKLYSVDMPYPKMGNEDFVGIAVPKNLMDNWILFRVPDRVGIPKAIKASKGKFDLVHYDSDKSYSGRKWAYPLIWDSLKEGGYFISDDIQDNTAFIEFCVSKKLDSIIVESQGKYVGIALKCN